MNKSVATTVPRQHRTICLFFCQEEYVLHLLKVEYFRSVLDKAICDHPELFPPDISLKYEMKDIRVSKRLKIYVRRITVNGYHYTVHPSFVMPYMTGFTMDVEKALFLRKFAVPFWALAYCFGKHGMYY